jgi:glycosyltransferase involved in cell wall biosynthesis
VKRLKVLFITAWYPHRGQPVAGVFIREHAKAVRLYDDVVVVHCCGPAPKFNKGRLWRLEEETDETFTEGIKTYRLWLMPFPIRLVADLVMIWGVFRAFRHIAAGGFRPDIIHAHIYHAGFPAVFVGKVHHTPVIVTEQFTAFPRRLLRRESIRRARIAFQWAHMVTPVSESLKRAIESYGIKARFRVVPNVVDTRVFSPSLAPRPNCLPKRLLVVALLSSSHVKGVPYLLRALAQLQEQRNDWHLDVVGDGPARGEYLRLTDELGLGNKVSFHGLKPKREVAEFMRQADVFVVPSLFETFSAAAAEALASGTPVLTTRCGGPEEFVCDGVGVVVPPADERALCEGLDYILGHLNRFKSAEISRHAHERFSPERVGETLDAIYRVCLAKDRG